MRRHSLFAPVTVLVIGLIIIVILLGTPYGQSSATLSFAYTAAEETATAQAKPYVEPTARAATAKAKTATNPNDNTNSNTAATSTVTTVTTTTTARPAVITPTVPPATRPAAPTSVATTPTPLPTETPLPSPTPLADFQCVPGVPVTIEGSGPPNSGILLLFNERIVSGGVTRSTGAFRMQLTVGDEDPGVYPVVVQVRGTQEQLLEKTCFVPAITPTPPPLGTGP